MTEEAFPDQLAAKKDKRNYLLIPVNALAAVADILTQGAKKWGASGWRNRKQEIYVAAAFRHIEKHRAGEVIDEESKMPHLYHAAANLLLAGELEKKRNDKRQ